MGTRRGRPLSMGSSACCNWANAASLKDFWRDLEVSLQYLAWGLGGGSCFSFIKVLSPFRSVCYLLGEGERHHPPCFSQVEMKRDAGKGCWARLGLWDSCLVFLFVGPTSLTVRPRALITAVRKPISRDTCWEMCRRGDSGTAFLAHFHHRAKGH